MTAPKILATLKAAGLGRRPSAAVKADIARAEAVLRRLKHEHMCACASERMTRQQQDPEFQRRRREGAIRFNTSARTLALRKTQPRPQVLRLPPMSRAQRLQYNKLRRAGGCSRAEALAALGLRDDAREGVGEGVGG